jgi:hypothetical protein
LNSKATVIVAGAMLVLASAAAMAYAAVAAPQQIVALQVGDEMGNGFTGAYGDEITLQPASMTSIERPGEKFHFQVYVSDVTSQSVPVGMQWVDFRDFEDIQLEDTNTVQPFGYELGRDDAVILGDGTVVYPTPPYMIRAEYKALDSSGTANSTAPKSYSETVTVSIDKNAYTRVSVSTAGGIRRAGTYFTFKVSPNSGPGTIRVTIKKSGAKNKVYNVVTDEDGFVSAKLKLGTKNGTYKVYAKFLGNAYGAASGTTVKTVRASR